MAKPQRATQNKRKREQVKREKQEEKNEKRAVRKKNRQDPDYVSEIDTIDFSLLIDHNANRID
jgi:hypothetical protein